MKSFPVLQAPKGCTKLIDASKLNQDWADRIHGQTLEGLASRGGLTIREIKLNVTRGKFSEIYNYHDADCMELVNSIAFVDKGVSNE